MSDARLREQIRAFHATPTILGLHELLGATRRLGEYYLNTPSDIRRLVEYQVAVEVIREFKKQRVEGKKRALAISEVAQISRSLFPGSHPVRVVAEYLRPFGSYVAPEDWPVVEAAPERLELSVHPPWGVVTKARGLAVSDLLVSGRRGVIILHGIRTLTDIVEAGYHLEGRVSLGRRRRAFTGGADFIGPNGPVKKSVLWVRVVDA